MTRQSLIHGISIVDTADAQALEDFINPNYNSACNKAPSQHDSASDLYLWNYDYIVSSPTSSNICSLHQICVSPKVEIKVLYY